MDVLHMTTSGAANDGKVVTMTTFSFLWNNKGCGLFCRVIELHLPLLRKMIIIGWLFLYTINSDTGNSILDKKKYEMNIDMLHACY